MQNFECRMSNRDPLGTDQSAKSCTHHCALGRQEGCGKGPVSCGFPGYPTILSRVFKGFPEAHSGNGQNSKPFPLAKERVVNKADLISALAIRTKMSKADAG